MFNSVLSLIVMNEILQFVIKNMELGNQMTFMVRPRPSGPWNEHRSWATEHVLSDFENFIYIDLWFIYYVSAMKRLKLLTNSFQVSYKYRPAFLQYLE